MGEDSKVAIRSIRRDGIDEFKTMQKNSEITEDELKMAEDNIQKITDKSIEEIDKILENKEKEVITFYITDDLNHLPVRLDMYLNFGSAKAFLSDIKGNRYPLTSIVKTK